MSRRAFTVIELLVVIGISALFSAFAITYSSIGRNEISLSIEAAKISQFILQAKELSIATYTGSSASCGYGVSLDVADQTYSIFAYAPAGSPPCPTVASVSGISSDNEKMYTDGTWKIPLTPGVVLAQGSNGLATVLFYPPEPTVFISRDGYTFESPTMTTDIYLRTVDKKNNITISVNPEGQVNF